MPSVEIKSLLNQFHAQCLTAIEPPVTSLSIKVCSYQPVITIVLCINSMEIDTFNLFKTLCETYEKRGDYLVSFHKNIKHKLLVLDIFWLIWLFSRVQFQYQC